MITNPLPDEDDFDDPPDEVWDQAKANRDGMLLVLALIIALVLMKACS